MRKKGREVGLEGRGGGGGGGGGGEPWGGEEEDEEEDEEKRELELHGGQIGIHFYNLMSILDGPVNLLGTPRLQSQLLEPACHQSGFYYTDNRFVVVPSERKCSSLTMLLSLSSPSSVRTPPSANKLTSAPCKLSSFASNASMFALLPVVLLISTSSRPNSLPPLSSCPPVPTTPRYSSILCVPPPNTNMLNMMHVLVHASNSGLNLLPVCVMISNLGMFSTSAKLIPPRRPANHMMNMFLPLTNPLYCPALSLLSSLMRPPASSASPVPGSLVRSLISRHAHLHAGSLLIRNEHTQICAPLLTSMAATLTLTSTPFHLYVAVNMNRPKYAKIALSVSMLMVSTKNMTCT